MTSVRDNADELLKNIGLLTKKIAEIEAEAERELADIQKHYVSGGQVL